MFEELYQKLLRIFQSIFLGLACSRLRPLDRALPLWIIVGPKNAPSGDKNHDIFHPDIIIYDIFFMILTWGSVLDILGL